MVIAVVSDWFSEGMGYAENYLPAAFSKIAKEVHVITSDLQIYGTDAEVYKLYEPFLGPAIQPVGEKKLPGFTLHRLPHYLTRNGIGIIKLFEKLSSVKPDLVYLFELKAETTLQAISYKYLLKYKIFCESRMHLSVYNPPKGILENIKHHFVQRHKWKQVGKKIDRLYPIAPDVLYVITKYFGQDKRKCKLSSLAVDTETFKPADPAGYADRLQNRAELNYSDNDIICIYTGRFTESKAPDILAKAIDLLQRKGRTQYKALFIGTGTKEYEDAISAYAGCKIHPFVPSAELVKFYQLADIGVWPRQESTSQLDAVACGLPIIISSSVEDVDRIDGNGLNFLADDHEDLAKRIEQLASADLRERFGSCGVKKINQQYSWNYIARQRIKDFISSNQPEGNA